ncbi:MAG: Gfo/Idh/MocA family oxidoreductase [Fuerstiella sp.]|nr:Gfo/Idh/MocA family oxidoreductase [Fuerstiella sp.]
MKRTSRRQFLSSVTAAGVVAATGSSTPVAGKVASNDQITVGLIGFRGMGMGHVRRIASNAGAKAVALCDIDDSVLARGAATVKDLAGNTPHTTRDFRDIIEDSSIDAVVIATPHHWHCPIAIPALLAGKDVYVEKPASHVFHEGRLLVDAAHKNNCIVQHGTQMRSSPVTAEAAEILASGILGDIKVTKAWNVQDQGFAKPIPDGREPSGIDYDRWLGPAKLRPFNKNRFHRTWRLFREYGNGDFGDDGAHDLDMAAFGLGVSEHPVRITAHGSNVNPPGYREFPDNMNVSFEYADGRVLIYEDRLFTPYGLHGVDSGNAFYGTEGYMIFSRRGFFRTYLGRKEKPGPKSGESGRVGTPVPSHMQNFLNSIRTREPTKTGAEIAHRTSALIHLGEIAYRTRTVLEFDPETERVTNSPKANTMLTKEYREPFGLPDRI